MYTEILVQQNYFFEQLYGHFYQSFMFAVANQFIETCKIICTVIINHDINYFVTLFSALHQYQSSRTELSGRVHFCMKISSNITHACTLYTCEQITTCITIATWVQQQIAYKATSKFYTPRSIQVLKFNKAKQQQIVLAIQKPQRIFIRNHMIN